MVEKDDWRLLNDVGYLKKANINPTDGGEILGKTSISEDYMYECLKCHILYSWDLNDALKLD